MPKHTFQTSIALAKSSFKLQNEGSYLGILWYAFEPMMFFALFIYIRHIVGKGIEYYPIYLLIGLLMFNFFRTATSGALRAIVSNSGLITNLKIRQEVFVLASFFHAAYEHLFELILLVIALLYYGLPLWYMVFYPVIFLVLSLFTLGLSFILSAAAVYINDLSNLWNVLTRILWVVTPIFYTAKLELPFDVNEYNPLYYSIAMARDIMISHQFPEMRIIVSSLIAGFGALTIGLLIFNKVKLGFAEKL